MATKAELFRYRQERSGTKRAKQPAKRRRDRPVNTALPGVSASDRKAGGGSSGPRNMSRSAARKASYMLEDSRAQASRKSTRKSANRQKTDSQLRAKRTLVTTSASERARRANAGAQPRAR
jgi:hypothetical protein